MNYKHYLASWFGLGLLMLVLQYPIWYIFKLLGMADMASVAIIVAGGSASMLYTQYINPHLMGRSFKIKAILTYFVISVPIALIALLFNSALITSLKTMIASLEGFQVMLFIAASVGAFLFAVGIQALCLYFLIGYNNKLILQGLEKKAKAI